jgi:DNA-binding XRE family transcriptional regulator
VVVWAVSKNLSKNWIRSGDGLGCSRLVLARPFEQTVVRAKLERRVAARLTQEEMAAATGISRAGYVKLEAGRHPNPLLHWLSNCAIVLDCQLEDLIEDQQREWLALSPAAPRPPEQKLAAPEERIPPSPAVRRANG